MKTNSFTYRTGTINDLKQLQNLRVISYGQFQNVLTPDNWILFQAKIQDEQRLIDLLNIAKCFVCLDNKKIIGMAFIIPSGNPTTIFRSEWAYLKMVGVNPYYQGRGIAKTLVKMCIDHAKQNNEKTIALHTSELMNNARQLYENFGFKVLEEIPQMYGYKYWLYTLDLT